MCSAAVDFFLLILPFIFNCCWIQFLAKHARPIKDMRAALGDVHALSEVREVGPFRQFGLKSAVRDARPLSSASIISRWGLPRPWLDTTFPFKDLESQPGMHMSHNFSPFLITFMGYPVPGQAFENLTALHLRIPANGSLKRRLPGILIPTASIHILLISEKDLGFLSGFEPLQFLFRSKSSSFSKVWPSYRHSSSDISLNDENAVMKPPPDGWS